MPDSCGAHSGGAARQRNKISPFTVIMHASFLMRLIHDSRSLLLLNHITYY